MSKQKASSLKIEAFFREFPFLERYLEKESVFSVRVSRVDENFLDYKPYKKEDFFGLIMSEYLREKMIFLGGENNEEILTVGKKKRIFKPTKNRLIRILRLFVLYEKLGRETVGEALKRVENTDDINILLSLIPTNQYDKWDVIIYKPPTKLKISKWREEQVRRHQKEIEECII